MPVDVDALRRYEPTQRYRHTSGQVGGKLLVYSGVTQDYSEQGRRRVASVVEVFDPRTESWETKQVKGDLPTAGVSDAADATIKEDLYMLLAFGDNLALLGRYGLPHGPPQPGSFLMKNTRFADGRGWTNELHIYSLKQGG